MAKKKAAPKQPELSPELKKLKASIDKFSDAVKKKFDNYILGVALLPPDKKDEKKVHLLVLVDDSDSKKMAKQDLKTKLGGIIAEIATKTDKNFVAQTWILSELWQECHDGKYDKLRILATCQPFFDKGILGACKVYEVHKQMVLEKFEKYIVCYVAAGALFRGEGNPKSDIDAFVVIDDTDVKKMTRAELKDRLTGIIYDMVYKAADVTGVKRKLHVQTYLLTDFWDSIKEANPVIFTFLRDGIPFFDRGMYMPWKQLLKLGKIKPSAESIDLFQNSGEQFLKRAKKKFLHAGVEDAYYAILNPSQAALMMYGLNPATPRETARLIREIFVDKEGILEPEYAEIIEEQVQVWKKFEYEEIKEMDGTTADRLIKNVEKYLKRIKELYDEIEKSKLEEAVVQAYDSVVASSRDVLKLEGVDKVAEKDIQKVFKETLVKSGDFTEATVRSMKKILDAQKQYKAGKITKQEIEKIKIETKNYVRDMVEFMERKKAKDLKKARLHIRYGEQVAEVIVFEDEAYIKHDVAEKDAIISKAAYSHDGGLGEIQEAKLQDFEHALGSSKLVNKIHLHATTFERLSTLLGSPIEVLVSN